MALHNKRTAVYATAVTGSLLLSACGGAGGGGSSDGDDKSIDVIMVGNPQMEDIKQLTADNFTKDTGITVNFTILPENEVRTKIEQDVNNGTGAYDVVTVGAYEVQNFQKQDLILEQQSYIDEDADFDAADLLPPIVEALQVDGTAYATPFYGESSMLMYRKDLADAAGVTISERPTWDEVAAAAAKMDDDQAGVAGICLRGLPGWGEMFAPLTTVVNTFGGTWFNEDWSAGVDSPEFTEAVEFYINLIKEHGEADPASAGFSECQTAFLNGNAAMWYDATSGAGPLEAEGSKVAGKVAYAYAPTKEAEGKPSGWLWTWSWAIPKTSKSADDAWEFISWASSKEYEQLVGEELGWSSVPDGKRLSTYEEPKYQEATTAFWEIALGSIQEAEPTDPGAQPRPAVGVQYVAIPEFAALADGVAQDLATAFSGGSIEEALAKGQEEATKIGELYAE